MAKKFVNVPQSTQRRAAAFKSFGAQMSRQPGMPSFGASTTKKAPSGGNFKRAPKK